MRFLNGSDFDKLDSNLKFEQVVSEIYSPTNGLEYQLKRYRELYKLHSQLHPDNVLMFSSPGRIEICGNHTDHNNGKVLCASITLDTIACVSPTDNNFVTVASVGYPPVTIDINDLDPNRAEFGTSEGLVRGVVAYFKKNGLNIGGFYATTTSDVFKGAGVSSSACFEVLISEILNILYNDGKIDPLTKVFASHFAESKYFGKPCGMMDQSAIAFGNVSYIDFKNPKKPEVQTLEWPFDDVRILICNCGGDHCNLTSEYASIRTDMEAAALALDKPNLRELSYKRFSTVIPELRKKLTDRQLIRALHFFFENDRVDSCALAINSENFSAFKRWITDSGHSSFEFLQNCYVAGSIIQPIPVALACIRAISRNGVAARVHGGGFAGTIIIYTANKQFHRQANAMSKIFGKENIHVVKVRKSGAKMIEL